VLEKANAASGLKAMAENKIKAGIHDYGITRIGTFCTGVRRNYVVSAGSAILGRPVHQALGLERKPLVPQSGRSLQIFFHYFTNLFEELQQDLSSQYWTYIAQKVKTFEQTWRGFHATDALNTPNSNRIGGC